MLRNHLGVDAILLIFQSFVISILNDPTLFEDNDTISFLYGRETMSDHKRGDLSTKLFFHLIDCFLHFSLIGLVECASCFVENEHCGLLDKGTSECESLLLATGQLTATGTDKCFDSKGILAYKSPGVGLLKSFLNFGNGRIGLSHANVLFDRSVEQDRLLADVANLLAVFTQVQCLQVLAINEDLTFFWVVKALGKLHDCGLARA